MKFSSPQIVRETDQLRRIIRGWRGTGTTIALVPLTRPINDGNRSVIETAKRHAARTIVSAPADIDMAQATVIGNVGCDLIFAPDSAGDSIRIKGTDDGLGDSADLDSRITSFARLLNQVHPDVVIFGEKDWRLLVAVRRMVRDLAVPVGVVSSATIRDADGLALSSQTQTLTPEQRATAPTLFKVLSATAALIANGEPMEQVIEASRKFLSESGFDGVHYLTARQAHDLGKISGFSAAKPSRLLGSVQLGGVTLSDNVPIART